MRPLLALLAVLGVAPVHLGSGDDVQPRDTVSIVESVSPELPEGVRVDVVGGDAFLRVRSSGHEVEVRGYEDEPYVRIAKDGTVMENRDTQTWVLSQNRYAETTGTLLAGSSGWAEIASNGAALWHDHRIHWMSRSVPVVLDAKGTVQHWKVPIVVDGTAHTVNGTLYLRSKSSVAWWLLVLPAAGVAALLALRSRSRYHSWLTWVSAFVTWVGFMQWWDLPSVARITPLLMFFGIASLITCNVAMTMNNRRTKDVRNEWMAASLAAGGGACMLTVTFMTWAQVRAAYVPMLGPDWIARAVVPLMVGTAVVAVTDGIVRVLRVDPVVQPGA